MIDFIRKIIPEYNSRCWFWLVMIVLLSFYPYKIANAYYPVLVSNIQTIFLFSVFLVGVVIFSVGRITLPRPVIYIVFIMAVGCFFSFIFTGHKYYYHKIIIMVGGLMLLQLVYVKVGMFRFFILYNRWVLVMAILAVIGFFLSMAGMPPVYVFPSTEDSRLISSWIVTFSKQITQGSGFIRPAGFFDEPGALGYWGIYTLVINKLFIKDSKLEKWLIVALLFFFFFGYYSQIIIFLILTVLRRKEQFGRRLIWLMILSMGIGVMYMTKDTKYNMVYAATIGRFVEASKGEEFLEGTSREKLTEDSKKIFLEKPWFGMGWPVDDDRYIGDNPYETLARDGIFGTVYLYFPFLLLLYWSIKRRDYTLFSMIMVMLAGFMHRPFHFNFLTFFIFYSIPLMYYQQNIVGDSETVYRQEDGAL